jgi:hypothetical protein
LRPAEPHGAATWAQPGSAYNWDAFVVELVTDLQSRAAKRTATDPNARRAMQKLLLVEGVGPGGYPCSLPYDACSLVSGAFSRVHCRAEVLPRS